MCNVYVHTPFNLIHYLYVWWLLKNVVASHKVAMEEHLRLFSTLLKGDFIDGL